MIFESVACLLAAAALGILGDEGLRWGSFGVCLFTAATLWLALSFGAGRLGGRWWLSAVLGSGALVASLASYYLWLGVVHDVPWSTLMDGGYRGRTFLAAGAAIGAISGILGGVSGGSSRLAADMAWCGLVAVPVVDGLLQYRYSGRDDELVVVAVFVALVALVAVAVAWALRSGARAWALLLGVPVASAVLYAGELVVLREVFGRFTWL